MIRIRVATWAAATVIGGALAFAMPKTTIAAFQQPAKAPVAGKPAYRFAIAADGNEARYRVREELVGADLPNDAIGVTHGITGALVLDKDLKVVRDSSRFVIDLAALKSDKTRRDNFLRQNTLETEKFPTAVFVPVQLRGFPSKLPTAGSFTFQMAGDLTIKGFTRPTVWNVTAQAAPGTIVGGAKTAFTFDDFKLDQPRVSIVLTVNDTIKLEYDFKLVRAAEK